MIGDSSMRMFFHFIVGVLSLGWAEWPRSLSFGRGPGGPDGSPSCLDEHRSDCMCAPGLRFSILVAIAEHTP